MNRRSGVPVWLVALLLIVGGTLVTVGAWSAVTGGVSPSDERSIEDWSRDNPLLALALMAGVVVLAIAAAVAVIRGLIRASQPHE